MTDTVRIRRANFDDAEVIADQRRLMFEEIYTDVDAPTMQAMRDSSVTWTRAQIEQEKYLGWLLVDEANEQIIGGAGIWLMNWCPSPKELTGNRAYVLNVYVAPDYRKRGLARSLMHALIAYSRHQRIALLSLHASEAGRPLYASLGFKGTNEMRVPLK